tara:strand:+ start:3027 stop:5636 length:2610 start_codon:yes stop_codon:yes gene_type:complete
MSKLLTQELRTRLAVDFLNGFSSNTEKSYFAFIGRPQEWGTDGRPSSYNDTPAEAFDVVENIIAAKQIFKRDASLVVPRLTWTSGTVYDFYDASVDPYVGSKFYVLTDDFNVYKCISNNESAQSTVKPTSESVEEEITSDGYVWKFLYKIRESQYEFITKSGGRFDEGFMPVEILPEQVGSFDSRILQRNVEVAAIHGEISDIVLVDIGDAHLNAIVQPTPTSTDGTALDGTEGTDNDITDDDKIQIEANIGSTQLKLNTSANASSAADEYNDDFVVHITSGTGKGTIRVIKDYFSNGIAVVDAIDKKVEAGSTYEVLPRIVIDGNGSGAVAIPTIDFNTKKITGIDLIRPGTGYSEATVTIRQKESNKRRDTSTAKAILSPKGGHGYDIAWELGASNVLVKAQFDNTLKSLTNRDIPTTRYHQMGLISNPLDNNTTTNVTGTTTLGLDTTPPSRQITIDNEYKTQILHFNECASLQSTDIEDLSLDDFIVGDIIKQGPDGSASQARGLVTKWEILQETAPAGFDSGCGCAELGPEGNPINIGRLTVNVLQGEFKGCGTTSYSLVREQYPKTFFSTDDTGYDEDTDKVETYEDSAFPQTITSVLTTGSYNDDSFPLNHFIIGDTSKIVGKITEWSPSDAGNGGVITISEVSRPSQLESAFELGWVSPSFDSLGNVVNGEQIHYLNTIDATTGFLDVDNGVGTTAGRITEVKTLGEFTDSLLLSGTIKVEVDSSTTLSATTSDTPTFSLGETIYQMPIGSVDTGPTGDEVCGTGVVAGFDISDTDLSQCTLELVNVNGEFKTDTTDIEYTLVSTNSPYSSASSGDVKEVTSVSYSEFSKKYGYNLLYIQNVETVQRADNQIDTAKIIIEF